MEEKTFWQFRHEEACFIHHHEFEMLSHKKETAFDQYDLRIISALGLTPFQDGDQWCFLWGGNIVEGICGFGDTVKEAAKNFNEEYQTKKPPKQ